MRTLPANHEGEFCSDGAAKSAAVRRRPAQGQYKSQEGHQRRQEEREGRLGEGQEEGARQRQLRHRHAAGAVRGTDAASMDGDPIYVLCLSIIFIFVRFSTYSEIRSYANAVSYFSAESLDPTLKTC